MEDEIKVAVKLNIPTILDLGIVHTYEYISGDKLNDRKVWLNDEHGEERLSVSGEGAEKLAILSTNDYRATLISEEVCH